ncbi:MAG: nuclear transport factor 2 family protein [bacterium]
MTPREILEKWIAAFNNSDAKVISDLYDKNAVNHQVANEPVTGQAAIRKMFTDEFANADMICIPENIFEDGDWAILEWKDPKGLRGCGFFQIKNDKIILQRGYWDKLSFLKLNSLPLPNDNILI